MNAKRTHKIILKLDVMLFHTVHCFFFSATGLITWEKFKVLFERKLKEDEEEKELKEAFRVLDSQKKGVIPVSDLRWILKSLGG
jgi:calmodulin